MALFCVFFCQPGQVEKMHQSLGVVSAFSIQKTRFVMYLVLEYSRLEERPPRQRFALPKRGERVAAQLWLACGLLGSQMFASYAFVLEPQA